MGTSVLRPLKVISLFTAGYSAIITLIVHILGGEEMKSSYEKPLLMIYDDLQAITAGSISIGLS